MRINIFSGARRFALVLAALATILTIGLSAFNEPYVSLTYTVAAPNAAFVHTSATCPSNGATHYITDSAPDGASIPVTLCLLPMKFGKEGKELIPYKVDDEGMVWGAEKYSSEVFAYEQDLERRFTLAPEDMDVLRTEQSRRYWAQWRESLMYLAIALGVFWALVAAVGWIVRGFAGIPVGRDSRALEKPRIEP